MTITAQPGYKVDPTNPNAVVKVDSGAMPGSVASIQQTQPNISIGAVNTQPIPISTLTQTNNQLAVAPQQTPDTTNYQGILDTAKNQVLAIQDQLKTQTTEQAKVAESVAQTPTKSDSIVPQWVTDLKNSLMGNIPQADTSLGSAYENDYSQQIDPIVQQKAEAQKIQKQAEFELNSVNAEIQGIYDSAKAQQIALQGQGRGQTIDFLNNQSAQIGRNAAIQVLPLQSKALVASAKVAFAQGNVELAQQSLSDAKDKLNTVFQYKAQDAENTYKNKMAMWDRLYTVANDAQQQALEEKKMQIEEQRYQQTEFNNLQQSYVDAAFNAGDYATASRLASAKTPEELSKLSAGITTKPDELKQLQIAKLRQELAGGNGNGNEILSIADAKALGVPYGTTKNEALAKGIVPGQAGGAGGTMQLAQAKGNIDTINSLLTSGGLSGSVGTNPLARLSPVSSLTGSKSNFLAGVQQITSQLSLDSLINAKAQGATFGALSEGELALLSASASKLNSWAIKDSDGKVTGYNTSEKSFKTELDRINNFAKLDYIVKGGDPADVDAIIQPDGTYWVLNTDGTYTQIK